MRSPNGKSQSKYELVHLRAGRSADKGMLLIDSSLRTIAFDDGAAAILNSGGSPDSIPEVCVCMPRMLLEMIRTRPPGELSAMQFRFRTKVGDYTCRAYPLESLFDMNRRTLIALHLERTVTCNDTLDELSAQYQLTEREHEALSGIAMGLTTKELADRMEISPNTVKAFLRLIMIKMGVRTRAGIAAKLLEHSGDSKPYTRPRHAVQVVAESTEGA